MLLICCSPPGCDAKPRIHLPDRCRRAAKPQPHPHWQPAKQYGQPDARHDGPVPSSAVLSGNCNIEIGIYAVFWLNIFRFFVFVAGFCTTTAVPAASVGVLSAGTGSSGRCRGAALLWSSSPQPAHHHEVPQTRNFKESSIIIIFNRAIKRESFFNFNIWWPCSRLLIWANYNFITVWINIQGSRFIIFKWQSAVAAALIRFRWIL